MNIRRDRFVRFKDWNSERSYSNDDGSPRKSRPSFNAVMKSIKKGFEKGSEKIKSFNKPLNIHSFTDDSQKELRSQKGIFNPQESFIQTWNKVFLIVCFIALALDPLFFYIPVVDTKRVCLTLDTKLEITACVLRTFIDLFYLVHMVFQFRTGFIAPSSRIFGRGELVTDSMAIAKKYLTTYFVIDLLAILPLPQIAILSVIPKVNTKPVALVTKDLLKSVMFTQYLPRIMRIYPLYKEVTRSSGIVTETAWAGAALNLFLYMLASHAIGSFWYLFSVERKDRCWRDACGKSGSCNINSLYCDVKSTANNSALEALCPLISIDDIKNTTVFNFGIAIDALQSGVVESWDFPQKFFYCFWWGLRALSSLGQNLKTSLFVGEIVFAVFISVAGLVLFALLIGNMQKYLESTTVRVEEMRVKRRDAEQWMAHRMLPENLRERIRRYEQYKWQETRGVEEEALLRNLPKDLRRDIKRHLCLDLLMKVPMFEKMDDQLLDALCHRLKPVLYTEMSFIVREGDPVEEMLFIMRGKLVSMTTNGGRTGFFNAVNLKAGDFCGDGILTWALDPQSPSNLPISTRSVQARTEVEAFALMADDLKFVASQFRRLHSKQLQHTFKLYSVQWKTWAATFIQAAWRRHCRRKLAKALSQEENWPQNALATESTLSLGATLYASKFASAALRGLRQSGVAHNPRLLQIEPLMPQKPAEPDFTADDI